MGTRNPYREALETELAQWEDVYWDFDPAKSHDRVVLYCGLNIRTHTFSRGAKAGRGASRATMNMRSDLRKLLKEIGAKEKT